MDKKRLNIGLFICHLDNDYAYDICKGVDYAAKELDVNLIVFPGMYINAAYNDPQKARFDYQYNSVFYYASKKNLDALIISMGTIGSFLSESDLQSFLANFKDIPILNIEIPVPGYHSLHIEGKTGLKKAIEHLINHHHKKKIGFVSGRAFNADAVERLETYKSTLIENNLPVDENLIVHGNFSEFCEDLVEQLLDNNPDLDAMVFANDQMALGGYRVFKRRGIIPGVDIAVTGYDDAPIALALDPPLSTAKASSSDSGYYSLYEVCNLLKHGQTTKTILNSDFIIRRSCGCGDDDIIPRIMFNDIELSPNNSNQITDIILETLLSDYSSSFIKKELNTQLYHLFNTIINVVLDDTKDIFPRDSIRNAISDIMHSSLLVYYSIDKLLYLFDAFNKIVLDLIKTPNKKIDYCETFNKVYSYINTTTSNLRYDEKKEYKLNIWSSSYITRDALAYGRDDKECYSLMMETLSGLPYNSTYVYLYDTPVMQTNDGSWKIPDTLLLQAYSKKDKYTVLSGDDRIIDSLSLFSNDYIDHSNRSTMVLTPIFTNEQHHGLFLCDVDISNFHHIYSTSLQLGTALKFLSLLQEQIATQSKLVLYIQEIHDKNLQLNKLSTSDELTGLYNRRGFLENAHSFIVDDLHRGKKAIIVFADMDNLKMVNDKFGHKDGDFALKSIASILNKSFRRGDVIGRLGGDEFVAFALLDESDLAKSIQHNIDKHSKFLNDTCGKPYYIDISIGISEFVCGTDVIIEDILAEADAALYSNKKYKRKSVLKNIG